MSAGRSSGTRACSTQASKMTRLTGASITQGATTPLLRMPAISVVVFQCPCGTAMRRRSPRGRRP
jgi:hypothetical protein